MAKFWDIGKGDESRYGRAMGMTDALWQPVLANSVGVIIVNGKCEHIKLPVLSLFPPNCLAPFFLVWEFSNLLVNNNDVIDLAERSVGQKEQTLFHDNL